MVERQARTAHEGVPFGVRVREDGEDESFTVTVPGTEVTRAGFGDDGPTESWVRERFIALTSGLRNDRPIIDQLREMDEPIFVAAEH